MRDTVLETNGPHSPDYTRQVGDVFAETVRVLAYATRGDAGGLDLAAVYSLVGALGEGVGRLPQVLDQTALHVTVLEQAGRLEVHGGPHDGDPFAAHAMVQVMASKAARLAGELQRQLEQLHNAVSTLAEAAPE